MWALSSPVGSSPDDNYHQTTIWCVDATSSTSSDTCQVTGTSETTGGRVVEVPALVGAPNCYAFQPAESGACQRPLEGEKISTETIDNGTYPGGFYRVMHLLVRDSIPESVLAMRFLNVTLAGLSLLRNPGSRLNRVFAYFASAMALWNIGAFMLRTSPDWPHCLMPQHTSSSPAYGVTQCEVCESGSPDSSELSKHASASKALRPHGSSWTSRIRSESTS